MTQLRMTSDEWEPSPTFPVFLDPSLPGTFICQASRVILDMKEGCHYIRMWVRHSILGNAGYSALLSLHEVAISARREACRLRMLVEIKGTDEPRVLTDSFDSAGEDTGDRSLVEIPRIKPVSPGIMIPTAEEAAWYALYTRSRFEKKLMGELAGRSIEVFLPMREVLSRWKDRKKRVWLPLFPGYIFVHHVDTPSNRHRILNVPGAVRFVGFNSQTVPVPLEQIDGIRRFLESNLALDPYPYMKIGRRVEVIAGPLKGIHGKLVQKRGRFRFVIQVDLIRQAVSVEIDASDVRPL